MGNNRNKKGQSGEVKRYITRNAAVKKLQLTLRDFRKICILKGIYPREPKHRQKVQQGDSKIKTLYYMKDIQFLLHEPIIWKFREHKACLRKVRKAYNRKDYEKGSSLYSKQPHYTLSHIIRERYPTFTDALRDLDDPLSLCSLFAKMARLKGMKPGLLKASRYLTTEFLLYVIEAQALRKVFISIKGYYYQAEIMGQTVTWIAPHPFTPGNTEGVDFRIMKTFLEFYMSLMGFVNFRLYASLNLHYPPKLPYRGNWRKDEEDKEVNFHEMLSQRLASLNVVLKRNKVEDDGEEGMDMHLLEQEGMMLPEAQEEEEKKKKQQNLFKGFKFFLNRETNMESLTFVIRSCAGQVSWDKLTSSGNTYPETDESITHQIVDRPNCDRKYLSRYYVQPQWVYDCVNARLLLPVQDYFLGAELPAHLSPFDLENDLYMPPEKEELLARQRGEIPEEQLQHPEEDSSDSASDGEQDLQPMRTARQKAIDKARRRHLRSVIKKKEAEAAAAAEAAAEAEANKEEANKEEKKMDEAMDTENGDTEGGKTEGELETSKKDGATECNSEDDEAREKTNEANRKKKEKEPVVMEVTEGKRFKLRSRTVEQQKREEYRLNIMMIPKKRKRLYFALKRKEDSRLKRAEILKIKRAAIDEKRKKEKRALRKQQREKEMKSTS